MNVSNFLRYFSQKDRIALEKEANEKKLAALVQRKGECEAIKENNSRDIEVMMRLQSPTGKVLKQNFPTPTDDPKYEK